MAKIDDHPVICYFNPGNGEVRPSLIIEFSPEIHPDNIQQVCDVIRKAVANKMECMNLTAIDEEENHAGNA